MGQSVLWDRLSKRTGMTRSGAKGVEELELEEVAEKMLSMVIQVSGRGGRFWGSGW